VLQTGRVQQGPSFCVRSPRGSGARVSAVYTVHSIQHPIQHPLGDGRPAGRSESVPNNGARGRPSPRLKREPHSTVCCLSTGDHRINHHDRLLGWVGQTSTTNQSAVGGLYARFGKRIASQRGLYLQLWFMAGLKVYGALLALKPVPKPVTRRKIHTNK
jgi:hypothetical protein